MFNRYAPFKTFGVDRELLMFACAGRSVDKGEERTGNETAPPYRRDRRPCPNSIDLDSSVTVAAVLIVLATS